jgi:hypothetical protein
VFSCGSLRRFEEFDLQFESVPREVVEARFDERVFDEFEVF